MTKGVIVISVRDGECDRERKNPYRTGGWVVLRDEAIRRLPVDSNLIETMLKNRFCFVEDEVWDRLGLPRGEIKEEADNGTQRANE
jgi:hypothetical protein